MYNAHEHTLYCTKQIFTEFAESDVQDYSFGSFSKSKQKDHETSTAVFAVTMHWH